MINTVYQRLRKVGAAISQVNGNNTHSGNLSMRDPENKDLFYITTSGSLCGDLVPQDVVPIRFSTQASVMCIGVIFTMNLDGWNSLLNFLASII